MAEGGRGRGTSQGRLPGKTRVAWLSVAVLLGASVAGVGSHPAHARAPLITVQVDGRPVQVEGPTATVGAVLRAANDDGHDGALVSVVSHRVIEPHYRPAAFKVDGQVGTRSTLVSAGAVVLSVGVADVVEGSVTTRVPAGPPPAPPEVEDDLWYPGSPSIDEVVAGEVSGEEVSRKNISPPVPPRKETDKVVALTFDDGPNPNATPQILQILNEEGIKATFCVVGHWADTRSELLRAERDAGMTICDHTQHHVLHLDVKPHDQVVQEVIGGADSIKKVLGTDAPLFRSPGGFLGPDIIAVAHSRGMRVVQWSDDPHDYERPSPEVILGRVLGAIHPGAVVLLHDGGGDRSQTVAMLRQLIDTLKAQGYGFATPLGPPPPPPPPAPAAPAPPTPSP